MRTVNAVVKTFGLGFSFRCFAGSKQRKVCWTRKLPKIEQKKPLKNGEIWPHLKNKKITMIKPLKQTNKQRKEGQKPLTRTTTILWRKKINIFSECFCSFLAKNYFKSTTTTTTEKKYNLETTWRLVKWHKNGHRCPIRESGHFNGGRNRKICY